MDIDKDIVIFFNVIVTEAVSIILLLVISFYYIVENLIIITINARDLGSENISSRVGSNDGTCFARISHGIIHLIL